MYIIGVMFFLIHLKLAFFLADKLSIIQMRIIFAFIPLAIVFIKNYFLVKKGFFKNKILASVHDMFFAGMILSYICVSFFYFSKNGGSL